ncbi:hypothetical protein CVT24_004038 [Panaeolus cyanescens]|uniref:Calcineurin-like phosphoesterase domain-containing protein n=1 Tax=Panaeolus cyanescens TaxID=181874 RepID=A0A409Y676_9AGAR|nr:hypothetical protein CVT24_004038 [Panaeolus cyanescens]
MLASPLFFCSILLSLSATVLSSPAQAPFNAHSNPPKKLHGRFLHITDIHPDPHYTPGTSTATACHRSKPAKHKDESHYFGTPYSDCDSPFRLTNFTLDYLDEHWADDIDFVLWTGDNARHDNDREIPRTPPEIYDLNRAVAAKMKKVFSSRGIPVVPSLGNNDIWRKIWSSFIPFPHLQVFQRGAYYAVEVIPDELAVISLNTLYFYDSNKVVAGCPYTDRNDPGNLELDWMEVQLDMYRSRGMQVRSVWISGHVPPSPGNYFPECYVRYAELALRYQDTILGHVYGHMNVDHFFFLESIDLEIVSDDKRQYDTSSEEGLFQTLMKEFEALPKEANEADLDNYAVVNVGPAVVPNPYVPTFRIFSYNNTEKMLTKTGSKRQHGHRRGDRKDKDTQCQMDEYKDTWRCHLNRERYSDSDSPSRRNQRFTPLGFAQYYIRNLEQANKTHGPGFELEYLTYPLESLHPGTSSSGVGSEEADDFVYPIPVRHLPESLRRPGIGDSYYAPYGMEDLTIGSYMGLAKNVAKRRKLQRLFRQYMFQGGEEEK